MSAAVPGAQMAEPPEAALDSDSMPDAGPTETNKVLLVPAERRDLNGEASSVRHSLSNISVIILIARYARMRPFVGGRIGGVATSRSVTLLAACLRRTTPMTVASMGCWLSMMIWPQVVWGGFRWRRGRPHVLSSLAQCFGHDKASAFRTDHALELSAAMRDIPAPRRSSHGYPLDSPHRVGSRRLGWSK